MRDFDIDGHMISAYTREDAIRKYRDKFGVEPEDVYEYEPEDEDFDPADEQAAYDDEWGDPLDMPSYAS